MPPECALWSCRWLGSNAGATGRPDRTHYLIDVMPDFVTFTDESTGESHNVEVVQIWVDPKFPEAWRDPNLLDYLRQQGEEARAAMIRYSAYDAFVLLPPALGSGQFREMRDGQSCGRTHSAAEIAQALSQ